MAKAKRKQRFFDVEMPIIGKETQLYAYDLEELKDRIISYDLTRILRGKSMLIKLKVSVDDKGATSSPTEIVLLPYFLRRMMRKGVNYVEDSFSIQTKNHQVKIKPFLITRKKVSREVRKALRQRAREEIEKYVESKDTEEIFDEILKGKLQKSLSVKLMKTYP